MKKYKWLVSLFFIAATLLFTNLAKAQLNKYKETWLTGHVKNVQDSVGFRVSLFNNQTTLKPTGVKININKTGDFRVLLPNVVRPMKLTLTIYCDQCQCTEPNDFGEVLVNPGDSIHLAVSTDSSTRPAVKFSGKGAAKFEIVNTLKRGQVGFDFSSYFEKPAIAVFGTKNFNDYFGYEKTEIFIADSLLKSELQLLNHHKNQISTPDLKIIEIDLTRSILLQPFATVNWFTGQKAFPLFERKKAFDFLYAHFRKYLTKDSRVIVSSPAYQKFLIELVEATKASLVPNVNDRKNDSFKKIYSSLKNSYTGAGRDMLLANYLTSFATTKAGIDQSVYYKALKETILISHEVFLKNILDLQLRSATGATPFNFRMPLDTSGKTLSLSDLKGDVVLVDMSPNGCGGCVQFAEQFHKRIWPKFKDDPHFKVVTIFDGSGKIGWKEYLERLRLANYNETLGDYDENHPRTTTSWMTYPNYIKLYGGVPTTGSKAIGAYYPRAAALLLMLVGKDGKLICSNAASFPYIGEVPEEVNVSNAKKLTEIIQKALHEPDSKK